MTKSIFRDNLNNKMVSSDLITNLKQSFGFYIVISIIIIQ